MAQFNLINTGTIQSNTASGTGNVSLSNDEILSLYDGNTTSSGVTVSGSSTLYLDIDLGFRVRLDDFNLYINVSGDRATALTNVDFYYKYLDTDSYTLCAKDYDADKFFADGLPSLFTPQFLRIIIDNQASTIYEVEALNDDTQVSFGENGNETLVILNQTTDGYDELGIFNNSSIGSQTVNAYTMIDYQGLDSDYYIKLADNKDGPYYGLEDGVDLKNNDLTKTYYWNMGNMENVEVNEVGHLKSSNEKIGYYTTPLFDMFDKLNNTFIMTEQTTISGSYITWDESYNTKTIRLRSSNEYPVPFTKFVWSYRSSSSNQCYLYIGDMDAFSTQDIYYNVWTSSSHTPHNLLFDRKRCKIYLLYRNTSNSTYRIRRYDYVNKSYEAQTSSESNLNNVTGADWSIDSEGRVWGYVKQDGFRLVQYSYNLATRNTVKEDLTSDFLVALSANKEFPSCWYTDQRQNKLEHVDYNGTEIASVTINSPGQVTSLPDGGCWVVNEGDSKIVRYSYYGEEVSSITFDSTMSIDRLKFGNHSNLQPYSNTTIWLIIDSQRVVQLDFEGNPLSETYLSNLSNIEPYAGGCLAHCNSEAKTYQLTEAGEIAYIWNFSSYSNRASRPYPMVVYYEEYLTLPDKTNFLPTKDDPYWGNNVDWQEIPYYGQKLSLHRYHQVQFKFTPKVVDAPINNPGAESGTSGWTHHYQIENENISTTTLISTSSAYAYSGTYAFHISTTTRYLRQRVHITLPDVDLDIIDLGNVYKFKFSMQFFYLNADTSNDKFEMFIRPLNSSMQKLSSSWQKTKGPGMTRFTDPQYAYWEEFSIYDYVPVGTRAFDLWIGGYDYTGNNSYLHFDDIKLQLIRSSSLDKVLIPSPVITKNISPQEFKNIYIQTDIPTNAEYNEYETRLKCWWGNEEE